MRQVFFIASLWDGTELGLFWFYKMEPLTRIELVTTSLPWRCSTTELQRLVVYYGPPS
jgi:hypothetical protein